MEDLFVKTKGKIRQGKAVYYYDDVNSAAFKDDYGRLVQTGFVFFDFDDQPYVDIITKIILDSGLRCKMLKTTRGVHFLFKTDKKKIINNSKNFNWLGLKCDVKGVGLEEAGKQCYQAVRVDGVKREETCLNHDVEDGLNALDLAPKWLYQAPKKRQIDLTQDQTGGRNDMFHGDMMIECKKVGFSYEEYCYIAGLINMYVLPEGLSDEELHTAIRQEEWDKLEIGDDKSVLLDKAQDVIDKWSCMYASEEIMFYDTELGHYSGNTAILENYIQEKYASENCTMAKIKEVMDHVNLLLKTKPRYTIERNSEYVICKDELVSMFKDERKPITRTIFTDVVYPYSIMTQEEFDKYNGLGKKFMKDISCNLPDVERVIFECMGCMLAPSQAFNKIFIWYGSGANGKSLLLKLMGTIMGELMTYANILNINDKFALESAVKGICNVTDDVGITTIRETGLMKSLVDGTYIEVCRKYKTPIKWKPNSQFVMCCNEIPKIADTTKGMIRRLGFIPFDMHLKNDEIDVFLFQKIVSEVDAMRYLMTGAIFAYREAVKKGHLTSLQKQEELTEDFIEENKDKITEYYDFLVETEADNDVDKFVITYLDGKLTEEVYHNYQDWCTMNGIKAESQLTFTRRFKKLLPTSITTVVRKVSGRNYNSYVRRRSGE